MKLEQNQHVKCFLRNSTVLEGKVESWSDTEIVLKSLDEKSLLIIHRPAEDIVLTKVILVEHVEMAESEARKNIREKLQEVLSAPPEEEMQTKNIAELREMVQQQERTILEQKRKEHFGTAGSSKLTQYDNPYEQLNYIKANMHTPPSHLRMHQNKKPRFAYIPGKLPSGVK